MRHLSVHYRLVFNNSVNNRSLVEITRLAALNPVEATIRLMNSSDRSTLLASSAPERTEPPDVIRTGNGRRAGLARPGRGGDPRAPLLPVARRHRPAGRGRGHRRHRAPEGAGVSDRPTVAIVGRPNVGKSTLVLQVAGPAAATHDDPRTYTRLYLLASDEEFLRRASLDLTGLPPSVEEVAAFVADQEPGAYGRVVDRLLPVVHHVVRRAGRCLVALARPRCPRSLQVDQPQQSPSGPSHDRRPFRASFGRARLVIGCCLTESHAPDDSRLGYLHAEG